MAGTRNDYILYRLSKAREAYLDAKYLAGNNSWNATINRLYYACFYAATALLLNSIFDTKTHSGVKIQLGLNFIKPEIIPLKFGQLYSDLMDWRQKGDYGDMFDFEADDVLPLFEPVETFIELIEKLVRNNS